MKLITRKRKPRLQPGNPTNKTRAKKIFARRLKVSPNPKRGTGNSDS